MIRKMRKCIVVLGMARTGSSAMSGILDILGVDFRKDKCKPANEFNKKGYFEHWRLMKTNRKILESLNSSWHHIKNLPKNWEKNEEVLIQKEKIKNILIKYFNDSKLFGLKDPRICLLLPLYLDIFKELNIKPYFVIMERNKIEIAISLRKTKWAKKLHFIKTILLCEKYKKLIEKYTKNQKRIYIEFYDLIEDPLSIRLKIIESFNLNLKNDSFSKEKICKFIDPELKHHNMSFKKSPNT